MPRGRISLQTKLAAFIKESVEALLTSDVTCCRYTLTDRLAVYVGWSSGYGDEERDDIIQASDNPDYGINVGIKVHTSDYMQTDYDWLSFPFYPDDTVWDSGYGISEGDREENYKTAAAVMVYDYSKLKNFNIEENGLILEDKGDD